MKRKELNTYMTWWNMLSANKIKQQSTKTIYDTLWCYSPYSNKIIHKNNSISTLQVDCLLLSHFYC